METDQRYNFKIIEENGNYFGKKINHLKPKLIKTKKNFTLLKCFLTHQEKFTWVMSEIIQ